MLIALKVDVQTLRGVREGVPRLVDVLQRHRAGATFYLTPGPDHRTLPPRTDMGRRAGHLMRHIRDEGFETGLRAYDSVRWQRRIVDADAVWVEIEMQRGIAAYAAVFGEPPRTHAAAGWRMNVHALRLTQRLGFDYASDSRGHAPYLPVWNAELIRCPQFPTTLPTIDELVGRDDITIGNVAAHLLRQSSEAAADQVFTLSAEREGGKLVAVFEQLVVGWSAQGFSVVRLRDLYEAIEPLALPRCETGWGTVPGRRHQLLVQQAPFLADADTRRAA